MQKEIYIIRHGETDFNQQGIVQGKGVNSSINAIGIEQAQKFYKAYNHVGFQKIYISRLQRTAQTIHPFIANGIKIEIHGALDEISWGIHEGQKNGDTFKLFNTLLEDWRNGELTKKIDGGESPIELQKRQTQFIKQLELIEEQKILVCTHGRSMRILLCTMLGVPLQKMDSFPHQNVSLYKLNFKDNCFSVELFNDSKHLD